jgi:hypothetical protein
MLTRPIPVKPPVMAATLPTSNWGKDIVDRMMFPFCKNRDSELASECLLQLVSKALQRKVFNVSKA